jgi:hypothetical protein
MPAIGAARYAEGGRLGPEEDGADTGIYGMMSGSFSTVTKTGRIFLKSGLSNVPAESTANL